SSASPRRNGGNRQGGSAWPSFRRGKNSPVDTMSPRQVGKGLGGINRVGDRIFSSISDASLPGAAFAYQPAVDDGPFVPSPGLEVEQWRPFVLEFKIEFQRVPPGGFTGSDGLGLKPSVPFLHHQSSGVLLLHPRGPNVCRPC